MNTGLRGPTQPNVPLHNVHIALQQLHCVAPPISIYSTSVAQTKAATDVRTHPHHPRLFDCGGGGWSSITSIHQTRGLKKSKIPKSWCKRQLNTNTLVIECEEGWTAGHVSANGWRWQQCNPTTNTQIHKYTNTQIHKYTCVDFSLSNYGQTNVEIPVN